MIQFSATGYSAHLVLWVSRDPFMWHAVGVFTATFLYAIATLAWIDRNSSGRVTFMSSWVVIGLLFASVAMFVGLSQRIRLRQINRMLSSRVIKGTRSDRHSVSQAGFAGDSDQIRGISHIADDADPGSPLAPAAIQTLDAVSLVGLARASG